MRRRRLARSPTTDATSTASSRWATPASPGETCELTVCNDGKVEGDEPCDDGNQVVGDGCTPFCELEPDCSEGACKSRCGDGLILPADDEECDDRNTVAGDGCSSDCKIEDGHTCNLEQGELPDVLSVPVTYRDFIALPTAGNGRPPDFQIFAGPDVTPGLVETELGADGKPVYAGICDAASTAGCRVTPAADHEGRFDQWYRDVADINVTKVERMELQRVANDDATRSRTRRSSRGTAIRAAWSGRRRELRTSTTSASPARSATSSSSRWTRMHRRR